MQHVVERPEDDAEPTLAEHLEHLVVPDPAQRVGPRGRSQEPEWHLVGGPGAALVPDRAGCPGIGAVRGDRRAFEEIGRPDVRRQQPFQAVAARRVVAALERWREQNEPPKSITAARVNERGRVDMTRPLCPYPQRAIYKGTGSINDAANYTCKAKGS